MEVELEICPEDLEDFGHGQFPKAGMCCPVVDCKTLTFFCHIADYQRHYLSIHTPYQRLHKCRVCLKSFTRLRPIRKHMRTQHPTQIDLHSCTLLANPAYVDPKGYKFPTEVEAHDSVKITEREALREKRRILNAISDENFRLQCEAAELGF